MTEILFYELSGQTLERVLPPLVARSLERGWRVVVQAASDERVEALDAHLWTWRDDAFLPHATWRDLEAAEQPCLLTVNEDNPNGAAVRFLLEGVGIPGDAMTYQRLVLLLDGDDPEALAMGQARASKAKIEGFAVTYWRSDEGGRWQRQA